MVLELICGECVCEFVCVAVCMCVHFFEEARKDFSPSGEERKREEKEGKDNLMSWFISYSLLAILFIFCKRFLKDQQQQSSALSFKL